ncbi:hypothetical protein F975_01148 [Acinetobacter sp. ANC 3789]|nr:hypothetical protein F975_01148 [Acinetobacter sp. ANC 3789]
MEQSDSYQNLINLYSISHKIFGLYAFHFVPISQIHLNYGICFELDYTVIRRVDVLWQYTCLIEHSPTRDINSKSNRFLFILMNL